MKQFSILTIAVGLIGLMVTTPASAIVWRDNLTDAQTQDLARQGQFAGTGIVSVSGSAGTGAAIAPGWVLSARHVVGNGQRVTFFVDGGSYTGTSISRAGSDIALIQLDANQQLPTSVPFIAPNPGFDPTGELIWKVGWGQFSSRADSQTNRGPSFQARRAGTNIVDRQQDVTSPINLGPSLIFDNDNTSSSSTVYEVSTAPGDSGGPMFYQHENRWYVAGTTYGAIGGLGFVDADVADNYAWILQQTGDIFAAGRGPTELAWDGDFAAAGVQQGGGIWDNQRPLFHAGGFNYTWENDASSVAVFGSPTVGASIISVQGDVRFAGMRFQTLPTGSGPFQLNDAGGTLTPHSDTAFIETQTLARIGAAFAGSSDLTKTGAATLVLDGDSSAFAGQWIVDQGTLLVDRGEVFGVGGFDAATKTAIRDGATLQLRGAGITTGEHFHASGQGVSGNGAIYATAGDHTFTERIGLQGDTLIRTNANTSLTFGGPQGRFYNQRALTKDGAGTVVFDLLNNIAGFTANDGVVAGSGGINGSVLLQSGSELRPGDSATAAVTGTFSTGDFTLASGAGLLIDLDPEIKLGDQVIATGSVTLAGLLELNLLSAPQVGDAWTLISQDGVDPILGGFANGSTVWASFGGSEYTFALNYLAGTGNDVGLVAVIPEPGAGVLLLGLCGFAAYRRRV